MLVLLEMAVQIGLLTEATVAQVTLEGLLLIVDIANVALEVGWDAERAVTVFTPAERGKTGGREEWQRDIGQKRNVFYSVISNHLECFGVMPHYSAHLRGLFHNHMYHYWQMCMMWYECHTFACAHTLSFQRGYLRWVKTTISVLITDHI